MKFKKYIFLHITFAAVPWHGIQQLDRVSALDKSEKCNLKKSERSKGDIKRESTFSK